MEGAERQRQRDRPCVRYRQNTTFYLLFEFIVSLCLVKTQVAEFTPKLAENKQLANILK